MRQLNTNAILFNAAGSAVVLFVVAYIGYNAFHTDEIARCTSRYPAGKQFAFDDGEGKPLTPIELQGRVGVREWGILKNSEIVRSPGGPGGTSLDVKLSSQDENPDNDQDQQDQDQSDRSGVGFLWPSSELSGAKSACLSYSVLLPPEFTFAEAGRLPGLYGAPDAAGLDEQTSDQAFAARLGWSKGGEMGADVRAGSEGFWTGMRSRAKWPTGRWVPVEQEIVLDQPSNGKGTLRVWVDGKLAVENRDVKFRAGDEQGLSGVVADIGYTRPVKGADDLKVSPFVVQWQ